MTIRFIEIFISYTLTLSVCIILEKIITIQVLFFIAIL